MKLYKNLVQSLIDPLQEVLLHERPAKRVLERLLKSNKSWGSRDRRFLADSFYNIIRYYRLFLAASGQEGDLNNWWHVLGVYFVDQNIELPHWPEWSELNPLYAQDRLKLLKKESKYRESFPDFLMVQGTSQYGDLWESIMHESNLAAKVYIRVNYIKTNDQYFIKQLHQEGIQVKQLENGAFEVISNTNLLTQSKAYKKGLFEIQDRGSQNIVSFANPKKNQIIVDACAGAGGKTLQMASITQNKSSIFSIELHEAKLQQLRLRAIRNGVKNVSYLLSKEENKISNLYGKANLVLIDAPCSGTGVLKRNPDNKWRCNEHNLSAIKETQREVLSKYAPLVKIGGTMVYATCSILVEENEKQIEKFLKENGTFELNQQRTILPGQTDGYYMASLTKLK